jgi:CIC family chloride channel protein
MTTTALHYSASIATPCSRWPALSAWPICIGLVSGLSCVGVRFCFLALQCIFVQHSGPLPAVAATLLPIRRMLTPACGGLLAMLVLKAARHVCGWVDPVDYVEAVRFRGGRIPFLTTAWRTASSACSIASGAAVGREGSMIQFSAAISSWLAERFPVLRFGVSRQVACGVAAGVAAAYQAPIAGAFFSLEIVLGEWRWPDLLPVMMASFMSWFATRQLVGTGYLFPAMDATGFLKQDMWALPLAVILGLAGPAYQALLRSQTFAARLPLPLLWGGLAVGLASLLAPAVWGNGDVALSEALRTPATAAVGTVLILRLIATTICVAAGTVGGVFTPTLFAGAAAGAIFAHLVHAPHPVLLAVVGMGAFLAAVTHAPLMASFMIVELTGAWHALPIAIILNLLACFISRRLSPHRSTISLVQRLQIPCRRV